MLKMDLSMEESIEHIPFSEKRELASAVWLTLGLLVRDLHSKVEQLL